MLSSVRDNYDKALWDKSKILEDEVFTLKWELLWKDGEYKKNMEMLENKLIIVK